MNRFRKKPSQSFSYLTKKTETFEKLKTAINPLCQGSFYGHKEDRKLAPRFVYTYPPFLPLVPICLHSDPSIAVRFLTHCTMVGTSKIELRYG